MFSVMPVPREPPMLPTLTSDELPVVSTIVQFAVAAVSARLLEPTPVEVNPPLPIVPVPARVMVALAPVEVLVNTPVRFSPAVPPSIVRPLPALMPRAIICATLELLTTLPVAVMPLPFNVKAHGARIEREAGET